MESAYFILQVRVTFSNAKYAPIYANLQCHRSLILCPVYMRTYNVLHRNCNAISMHDKFILGSSEVVDLSPDNFNGRRKYPAFIFI